MRKLTLVEHLERVAARNARAERGTARLKLLQRKERTRHLIETGSLAIKAGVDQLPSATLYGRLLSIAVEAMDKKAMAAWEWTEPQYFQAEEDSRVAAVANFHSKIEPEPTTFLRSGGFRRNRYLKQWEGKVEYGEVGKLVEGLEGSTKKLGRD